MVVLLEGGCNQKVEPSWSRHVTVGVPWKEVPCPQPFSVPFFLLLGHHEMISPLCPGCCHQDAHPASSLKQWGHELRHLVLSLRCFSTRHSNKTQQNKTKQQ